MNCRNVEPEVEKSRPTRNITCRAGHWSVQKSFTVQIGLRNLGGVEFSCSIFILLQIYKLILHGQLPPCSDVSMPHAPSKISSANLQTVRNSTICRFYTRNTSHGVNHSGMRLWCIQTTRQWGAESALSWLSSVSKARGLWSALHACADRVTGRKSEEQYNTEDNSYIHIIRSDLWSDRH
jgi:hypothetical protein